jgi:hypothetical protein
LRTLQKTYLGIRKRPFLLRSRPDFIAFLNRGAIGFEFTRMGPKPAVTFFLLRFFVRWKLPRLMSGESGNFRRQGLSYLSRTPVRGFPRRGLNPGKTPAQRTDCFRNSSFLSLRPRRT